MNADRPSVPVALLPVAEQNNANGGLVRLWCQTCRRYGDHMSDRHPASPVIPDCQGFARFDTLAHAERLMDGMVEEFGGTWRVMKHGEHFHVAEVPTIDETASNDGGSRG